MNNLNTIQSLNLADLDVVELERRLELSMVAAEQASSPWICIGNDISCSPVACGTNGPQVPSQG